MPLSLKIAIAVSTSNTYSVFRHQCKLQLNFKNTKYQKQFILHVLSIELSLHIIMFLLRIRENLQQMKGKLVSTHHDLCLRKDVQCVFFQFYELSLYIKRTKPKGFVTWYLFYILSFIKYFYYSTSALWCLHTFKARE